MPILTGKGVPNSNRLRTPYYWLSYTCHHMEPQRGGKAETLWIELIMRATYECERCRQ